MNHSPKILIVEDDPLISKSIKKNLDSNQYQVFMEDNGTKGYQKAVEIIPDLIVTDVVMSEMDGIEMIRQIRNQPNLKEVPIIVLTNLGYPGRVEEANELKVEYFVKANTRFHNLLEIIKQRTHNQPNFSLLPKN